MWIRTEKLESGLWDWKKALGGDKREKRKWEDKGQRAQQEMTTGNGKSKEGGANRKGMCVKTSYRNNCYL